MGITTKHLRHGQHQIQPPKHAELVTGRASFGANNLKGSEMAMHNNDEQMKKSLEAYFITGYTENAETTRRYIREMRERDPKWLAFMESTAKIRANYNEKEMELLARGNRIIPSLTKKIDFEGEVFRFAHITDTHMGAVFFKEYIWNAACREIEKKKVDAIFHTGDVTEGMNNARIDMIYDLTHIGYDKQKEYAIEKLKQLNAPIYAVDGNHDRWFKKSSGALVVKDIAEQLPNMHYLGEDSADVKIANASIRLWHGEDGSCFDEQTMIFTDDGWKYFNELSYSDQVATMTKESHEFQWQQPTDIYHNHYEGDIYHFKSRTIDCMVTPNHGMWTRASAVATAHRKESLEYPTKSHKKLNTEWHRKDAKDISDEFIKQKWQFTKVCDVWNGDNQDKIKVTYRESKNKGVKVFHYGELPIEDVAELIAWYVTEGHARKNQVSISQYKSVNPDNHNQIIELVKRIGGKYSESDKEIRIGSAELSEWLRKECGHKSRYKYLPKWLKESKREILDIVLETMIKGDGWIINTNGAFGYRSISKQLLNDFSEIAIKCGYSVTYNNNREDCVGISRIQVMPTVNHKPEKIKYSGNIYCCEVPNGLILVRRNGQILWTHNSYAISYRPQKIVEAMSGGDKPNILLTGHVHKAGYFFIRNIHVISGGAVTTQSNWMKRTRKENHTGFWICEAVLTDGGVGQLTATFYPFYE